MTAEETAKRKGWRVAVVATGNYWHVIARQAGRADVTVGDIRAGAANVLEALRARIGAEPIREVRVLTDAADQAIGGEGPRVLFVTTKEPDTLPGVPELPPAPSVRPDRILRVPERVRADGTVERVPQLEDFVPALTTARNDGFDACAIRFANAGAYPIHEQLVQSHAVRLGFEHVAASYHSAPNVGFVERAERTLLDAWLGPVASAVLADWQTEAPESEIRFQTRDGGLVDANELLGSSLVGSVASAQREAAEAGVSLAELLQQTPLHAVRHHVLDRAESVTGTATNMIVSRLRDACFTELRARGADPEAFAWYAVGETEAGDVEIGTVAPAPPRAIRVEAIDDVD